MLVIFGKISLCYLIGGGNQNNTKHPTVSSKQDRLYIGLIQLSYYINYSLTWPNLTDIPDTVPL